MPGSIPCLGYPSRTHAIRALKSEGLGARQIAERTGVDLRKVYALMASADRPPRSALPTIGSGRPLSISLSDILPDDRELRLVARRHAARRGMSIERLVRSIVERVIEDDIVDAVLDDADEIRRAS